ncbi:MAG: ABC transporter ATP-binding protein [Ruminiclostridium sp.]
MINVDNITKQFGDFYALNEFSLNVKSGSAYGLLGSNGAGKSTLLRILAGIYRQDSGEVTVDGEKIYDNVAVKQRIFYVSDDVEQYANMTPDDMEKMYEIFYPTFSKEKFDKLMAVVDLPRDKRMSTFSKGMKRQAAVICGLAASTDILLLDEAFDGLDPTMRINVRKMLFDAMAENNSTVIISSHNLTEIEELCDSVGLVHKGKVIFDRELDNVKGNLHKIQVSFDGIKTAADLPGIEILSENTIGSVQNFIVKGNAEEACRVMRENGAKFCDVIPLTLNEIFIYEMEGLGYDSSKLDK